MDTFWYFILYALVAIWVFLDAKKRGNNAPLWGIATVALGLIVTPFYLAKRYLLAGEVREGGVAWNVLRYFALLWTLTMAIYTIGAMSSGAPVSDNQFAMMGAAIGTALGVGMLLAIWFMILVGALALGIFFKQPSVIENGPTGPMTTTSRVKSTLPKAEFTPTIEDTPFEDVSPKGK